MRPNIESELFPSQVRVLWGELYQAADKLIAAADEVVSCPHSSVINIYSAIDPAIGAVIKILERLFPLELTPGTIVAEIDELLNKIKAAETLCIQMDRESDVAPGLFEEWLRSLADKKPPYLPPNGYIFDPPNTMEKAQEICQFVLSSIKRDKEIAESLKAQALAEVRPFLSRSASLVKLRIEEEYQACVAERRKIKRQKELNDAYDTAVNSLKTAIDAILKSNHKHLTEKANAVCNAIVDLKEKKSNALDLALCTEILTQTRETLLCQGSLRDGAGYRALANKLQSYDLLIHRIEPRNRFRRLLDAMHDFMSFITYGLIPERKAALDDMHRASVNDTMVQFYHARIRTSLFSVARPAASAVVSTVVPHAVEPVLSPAPAPVPESTTPIAASAAPAIMPLPAKPPTPMGKSPLGHPLGQDAFSRSSIFSFASTAHLGAESPWPGGAPSPRFSHEVSSPSPAPPPPPGITCGGS